MRMTGRDGDASVMVAAGADVQVRCRSQPGLAAVVSPEALAFVAALSREFSQRVSRLLQARQQRQAAFDAGELPAASPPPPAANDWTIAPLPRALRTRTVEITGPPDRRMIVNALNSGADVFMADFEDACSPTWRNIIAGQLNLRDAVRRAIDFTTEAGKRYRLDEHTATLMVRPRGWHLREAHVCIDNEPMPAALFDFGVFFFHNAHRLLDNGAGPYFYLPKLESASEARLWDDVFRFAQDAMLLPHGTIKATVLIETLPAAFEMENILYALRVHAAGLNCGRWDYIFSYIKTFRNDPARCLPDRAHVTMTQPFMRAYTQRVVQTCHRRGALAIGGMAAQIPIKNDHDANALAMDKVLEDKIREVRDGHDGTWVAHPGLVDLAREAFSQHMDGPNQLHVLRDDLDIADADLLVHPHGPRTENGLRQNIRVGVQYLEAWLRGQGCVPLYHLMEDAATAEISRAQLWQWLRHNAPLDDGRSVTGDLVAQLLQSEMHELETQLGEATFTAGQFAAAADVFASLVDADQCEDFLTSQAYQQLLADE